MGCSVGPQSTGRVNNFVSLMLCWKCPHKAKFVVWLWPKHSYVEHLTTGSHISDPLGNWRETILALIQKWVSQPYNKILFRNTVKRFQRNCISQITWRTKVVILRQHETDVEKDFSNRNMKMRQIKM